MSGREESGPTPTEVFEILGNETRLAIIEELAKPRRTQWQAEGLPFAELRKAVGVEDAGTFNYHLQKLQDQFVMKYGEKYILQNAGFSLAGAIRAGTYTERIEPRRKEIDRRCPTSGNAIEAIYESGYFRLECPEHGTIGANALPPGAALGRSMDDLVALADRDARRLATDSREGVCPHCWGPMKTTVPAGPSPRFDNESSKWIQANFSCERCEMALWLPVVFCQFDHPAVVSFYWEHDIDILRRGYLEDGLADNTLLDEDPLRIGVEFAFEDDTLQLLLDETLSVVEIR